MEEGKRISVAYSSSAMLFDGLLMAVVSLLKNTPVPVDLYLSSGDFTAISPRFGGLTPEMVSYIGKAAGLLSPDSRVVYNDMSRFASRIARCKGSRGRFSPFTFLRLFYDLVGTLPDRLLHLDVDTLVLGDVSEIYGFDMRGKPLAAVKDPVMVSRGHRDYFNAGVVLMDLPAIREGGYFEEARYVASHKRDLTVDQGALNRVFKGKTAFMPQRYNEIRKLRDDTLVRHYCAAFRVWPYMHMATAKPWEDSAYFHRERKEYRLDPLIGEAKRLINSFREGKEPEIS